MLSYHAAGEAGWVILDYLGSWQARIQEVWQDTYFRLSFKNMDHTTYIVITCKGSG